MFRANSNLRLSLAPGAVVCLLVAGVLLATACSADCVRLLAASGAMHSAQGTGHHHGMPAGSEEHPAGHQAGCATHGLTLDFTAAAKKVEIGFSSFGILPASNEPLLHLEPTVVFFEAVAAIVPISSPPETNAVLRI